MINRHPYIEYITHSPFRRPTWRWDRGMQLARVWRPPSSKHYDWWVQAVFWLAVRKSEGKPVSEHHRPVVAARELFEAGGPVAWEIESRTLAREKTRAIAAKCSLPAETVFAFQRLFLGYEDRLDDTLYIHSTIIGTHEPWRPSDVRKVWLFHAYVGGLALLDRVIVHYYRTGAFDYQYLLARKPETRQRDLWDLQWETMLRTRFCDFTLRQAAVLADMAACNTLREPAAPSKSPAINTANWIEQQLGALFVVGAETPAAAVRERTVA